MTAGLPFGQQVLLAAGQPSPAGPPLPPGTLIGYGRTPGAAQLTGSGGSAAAVVLLPQVPNSQIWLVGRLLVFFQSSGSAQGTTSIYNTAVDIVRLEDYFPTYNQNVPQVHNYSTPIVVQGGENLLANFSNNNNGDIIVLVASYQILQVL